MSVLSEPTITTTPPEVDAERDARGTSSVPTVSVVIPARNEALNLPYVLRRLPDCVTEVVLVDGRSTDDTVAVTRKLWPNAIIVAQEDSGKGAALAEGFRAATGEIIVMLDADGSTDPREIDDFVQALLDGADFAKGSRFLTAAGSADLTALRRVGNRFLARLVNSFWKVHYTDLCYGYNAFWARCLESVAPDCPGFEVETLMSIRVAQAGLQVTEVPSFEKPRVHGRSNLRPIRDGMRVLRTILRERQRDAEVPDPGGRVLVDLTVTEPRLTRV